MSGGLQMVTGWHFQGGGRWQAELDDHWGLIQLYDIMVPWQCFGGGEVQYSTILYFFQGSLSEPTLPLLSSILKWNIFLLMHRNNITYTMYVWFSLLSSNTYRMYVSQLVLLRFTQSMLKQMLQGIYLQGLYNSTHMQSTRHLWAEEHQDHFSL